MKTGKTYRGIGQVGERERAREWIRGEREVMLVERGNGVG
jgi:hypothetical protein